MQRAREAIGAAYQTYQNIKEVRDAYVPSLPPRAVALPGSAPAKVIDAHGCILQRSFTVPAGTSLVFLTPPGCSTTIFTVQGILTSREKVRNVLNGSMTSIRAGNSEFFVDRRHAGERVGDMLLSFIHNLRSLFGVYDLPLHPSVLRATSSLSCPGNTKNKIDAAAAAHVHNHLDVTALSNKPATIRLSTLLRHLGPGTYVVAACRGPCSGVLNRVGQAASRLFPSLATSIMKNKANFKSKLSERDAAWFDAGLEQDARGGALDLNFKTGSRKVGARQAALESYRASRPKRKRSNNSNSNSNDDDNFNESTINKDALARDELENKLQSKLWKESWDRMNSAAKGRSARRIPPRVVAALKRNWNRH